MSDDRRRPHDARPGHLRGAEERLRHDRRPDGGADPAHLPLVRDLRARLLLRRSATASGNTVAAGHARTSPSTSARCTSPPRPSSRPSADDIHPGDVFVDQRPVPRRHALQRRPRHPADLPRRRADRASPRRTATGPTSAAACPGSFDVNAREHFGEGLRIPPVRLWDRGRYLHDVAALIVSNMRAPRRRARATSTRRPRRRGSPSARCFGSSASTASRPSCSAFGEVQDYVERLTRQRDRRAARRRPGRPRTTSTSTRPRGEGLIPIQVQHDDRRRPDRTTTSPARTPPSATLPATRPSAAPSPALVAGTKIFFPDVPLNSGFYRAVDGRPRAGGHGRQRRRGRPRSPASALALREDHERVLRALVGS